MKVYFAADHAGFDLKQRLMPFVASLGHETEDCGAYEMDAGDDYPQIIAVAARALSEDAAQGKDSRAIVIGASGEGEAIAANRFHGVRAVLYCGDAGTQTDISGEHLDILESSRRHNNANALALGARFISPEKAQAAVRRWLEIAFSGEERHVRRIAQLDTLTT